MKYINVEHLIHDLEERIYAYSEGYADGDDCRKDAIETLLKDVKYQYSLQQEQPSIPDLDEAAEKWCKENNKGIALCDDKKSHYLVDGMDAFKAGAEWQYKNTITFLSEVMFQEMKKGICGWGEIPEK